MAGLSTKAIKNRIKSMHSTRQITNAMELVAASKLRSAQQKALSTRYYFETLYEAMQDIAGATASFVSPFLRGTDAKKPLYVVIAGDRGLAGGYNSNVFRTCSVIPKGCKVFPIGKRSLEYFAKRDYEVVSTNYIEAAAVEAGDCFSIANLLAEGFLAGDYDSIYIVYTKFNSILSQTPQIMQLLPFVLEKREDKKPSSSMLYEPNEEELFNSIVPEYIGGVLFGALCESIASEQAARRQAMNSATKNADEIIDNLNLAFNRARQGAITQEITEIVAGSNALD